MIYFHYCERNWRWFIRDMEKRARSTGRASALWLGNEPRFATGMPVPPKHAPLRSAGVPEKSSILQYITRLLTFRAASPDEAEQPPPGHPGYKVAMNQLKYQDLQSLASLARQIEEARLTVQLNRRVLEEAIAYYQEAVESDAIESKLRRQMAKSVLNFSGQVHEIAEKLKTSQTQLESLGTRVKNDADLVSDSVPVGGIIKPRRVSWDSLGFAPSVADNHWVVFSRGTSCCIATSRWSGCLPRIDID